MHFNGTTKTWVSASFDKHLCVEPQTKFVAIIYILTHSMSGKIRIQVRTALSKSHTSEGRQPQCQVVFFTIKNRLHFYYSL